MYVIYALIDPRDNTVHYVGQTSDVYGRFQQHIDGKGSYAKNIWIFELRATNRMIIMETLEEVETYQEAIEREAYWIKHFEVLKEPLLNVHHRSSARKAKKANLRSSKKNIIVNLLPYDEPREEVLAPLQPKIKPNNVKPSMVRSSNNLELARKFWDAGYQTCRDMAKAFNDAGISMGRDTASKIIREIKHKTQDKSFEGYTGSFKEQIGG